MKFITPMSLYYCEILNFNDTQPAVNIIVYQCDRN